MPATFMALRCAVRNLRTPYGDARRLKVAQQSIGDRVSVTVAIECESFRCCATSSMRSSLVAAMSWLPHSSCPHLNRYSIFVISTLDSGCADRETFFTL